MEVDAEESAGAGIRPPTETKAPPSENQQRIVAEIFAEVSGGVNFRALSRVWRLPARMPALPGKTGTEGPALAIDLRGYVAF